MHYRSSVCILALFAVAATATEEVPPRVQLGLPAPEVAGIPLEAAPMVLVLARPGHKFSKVDEPLPEAWRVIALSENPADDGSGVEWQKVEDMQTLGPYADCLAQTPGEGALAVVVDANRIVRRITRVGLGQHPADVLKQWLRGRVAYEAHCVRCHGADGKDESYPLIRRIDGLGRHLSEEEILDATWEAGFVSPHSLDAADHSALAAYVAGL